MEFDHNKVRRAVKEEEDRLSSLPDDLIHKILSCFDMKFAVQTCLLSSRWEFLWTSMTCLNFSHDHFRSLRKFDKFVTHVLNHRNHQIEVSSVKLDFYGAANNVFVRKIAKYAFSHNVQQLSVLGCHQHHLGNYHPSLFSSQSLKHFTFGGVRVSQKIPFDYPALTTLYLIGIELCGELFSKCVNLKNFTLQCFSLADVEVFDIITPRLSDLKLIRGQCSKDINLIAPQLKNLTVCECSINYLNAPLGLSSLCYQGFHRPPLSKDRFHYLEEVDIDLCMDSPYKEEDARKIVNILQDLHSAKYLTLNADIIECISSFPDLLPYHASALRNLISLTIDSSKKKDPYKVKMSTEARNFLLENSPSAKFIMKYTSAAKDWPT